eukprot:3106507-Heterocapsa_arctica.AAC.1
MPGSTHCQCSIAMDLKFGATVVIKMPDNIGWLPAIAEPPSQRKGKGKGKAKTSPDGSPLWPKQTKAAVQQGQMAI